MGRKSLGKRTLGILFDASLNSYWAKVDSTEDRRLFDLCNAMVKSGLLHKGHGVSCDSYSWEWRWPVTGRGFSIARALHLQLNEPQRRLLLAIDDGSAGVVDEDCRLCLWQGDRTESWGDGVPHPASAQVILRHGLIERRGDGDAFQLTEPGRCLARWIR